MSNILVEKLYNNESNHDVIVGLKTGEKIYLHRIILSIHSNLFEINNEITFHYSSKIVKNVFKYMYGGILENFDKKMHKILKFAEVLNMDVKRIINEKINEIKQSSDLVRLLKASFFVKDETRKYLLRIFYAKCKKFHSENIEEIYKFQIYMKNKEFEKLFNHLCHCNKYNDYIFGTIVIDYYAITKNDEDVIALYVIEKYRKKHLRKLIKYSESLSDSTIKEINKIVEDLAKKYNENIEDRILL